MPSAQVGVRRILHRLKSVLANFVAFCPFQEVEWNPIICCYWFNQQFIKFGYMFGPTPWEIYFERMFFVVLQSKSNFRWCSFTPVLSLGRGPSMYNKWERHRITHTLWNSLTMDKWWREFLTVFSCTLKYWLRVKSIHFSIKQKLTISNSLGSLEVQSLPRQETDQYLKLSELPHPVLWSEWIFNRVYDVMVVRTSVSSLNFFPNFNIVSE
jgi:hypothetical protein